MTATSIVVNRATVKLETIQRVHSNLSIQQILAADPSDRAAAGLMGGAIPVFEVPVSAGVNDWIRVQRVSVNHTPVKPETKKFISDPGNPAN